MTSFPIQTNIHLSKIEFLDATLRGGFGPNVLFSNKPRVIRTRQINNLSLSQPQKHVYAVKVALSSKTCNMALDRVCILVSSTLYYAGDIASTDNDEFLSPTSDTRWQRIATGVTGNNFLAP